MIGKLNEIVIILAAPPALFLVVKGTVAVALGLIGAWLARNSRAAVRHALLASAFAVLLALPVVSIVARPVSIAVPVTSARNVASPLFDDIVVPAPGVLSVAPNRGARSAQGLPEIRFSTVLLYGWFIGIAVFAILTVRGILQVRFLRRFALPWPQGQAVTEELGPGMGRRVEVLLHETLTGPLTCGVLRPAIILPADAEGWNKQDLERALIHELEHVRRHDWAFHFLARIACAGYWFHPLVWTAWRQLALEAERACDDAVLRRSEPIAYADQLLGLARRLPGARRSPLLAMANRSDLSARVRAMLDGTQRRGPVGAVLLIFTCSVAAILVLAMSPLRMIAAPQGNTPAAIQDIPKWDAVSIKRCTNPPVTPVEGQGKGASQSPDRRTWNCVKVSTLIDTAYSIYAGGQSKLPPFPVPVERLPSWADSEFYTIEAKSEGSPDPGVMLGPMLQALLENRFALKIRRETREGRVYLITVAKSGPKLPPFEGGCTPISLAHPAPIPAGQNSCRATFQAKGANQTFDDPGFDLDSFALWITRAAGLDGPLLNRTGLAGYFHLHVEFLSNRKPGDPGFTPTDDPPFPSVFTAMEQQLGLKVEAGKGPRESLVVDRLERPTEN